MTFVEQVLDETSLLEAFHALKPHFVRCLVYSDSLAQPVRFNCGHRMMPSQPWPRRSDGPESSKADRCRLLSWIKLLQMFAAEWKVFYPSIQKTSFAKVAKKEIFAFWTGSASIRISFEKIATLLNRPTLNSNFLLLCFESEKTKIVRTYNVLILHALNVTATYYLSMKRKFYFFFIKCELSLKNGDFMNWPQDTCACN